MYNTCVFFTNPDYMFAEQTSQNIALPLHSWSEKHNAFGGEPTEKKGNNYDCVEIYHQLPETFTDKL